MKKKIKQPKTKYAGTLYGYDIYVAQKLDERVLTAIFDSLGSRSHKCWWCKFRRWLTAF